MRFRRAGSGSGREAGRDGTHTGTFTQGSASKSGRRLRQGELRATRPTIGKRPPLAVRSLTGAFLQADTSLPFEPAKLRVNAWKRGALSTLPFRPAMRTLPAVPLHLIHWGLSLISSLENWRLDVQATAKDSSQTRH